MLMPSKVKFRKQQRGMSREYWEEVGIQVDQLRWFNFLNMTGRDGTWMVYFFRTILPAYVDPSQETDEVPVVVDASDPSLDQWTKLMPNLRWIIPLALHHDRNELFLDPSIPRPMLKMEGLL